MKTKHFIKKATALKYDQNKDHAPMLLAKGSNKTAQHIIKLAKENDIPIKKDEDLVEMLSQIELNKEIPIELYQAVAEVFSFIYGVVNEKETN